MRARTRDERGTATAFVVGFAIVLLACAGLVIDGGTALNERMKLADDVEQAARAGAQQINVVALRDDNVIVLDRTKAEGTARSYLAQIGYASYDAQVVDCADGAQDACVRVAAQKQVPTTMLRLAGVPPFTVKGSATAQAVTQ